MSATDAQIQALGGQLVDDRYNVPASNQIKVQVPTQIGDGLAGPRSVQRLNIYRDALPIAADELAFQKSLGMEVIARRAAGRYFFLNPDFTVGGPGLDAALPGLPLQAGQMPSPLGPLQLGVDRRGLPPPEVLPPAQTVYYTASPYVGYTSDYEW